MKFKIITLLILSILVNSSLIAQKTIKLEGRFNKLIVSPHIEAVFIKGDKPSIELLDITVAEDKFKYELTNNTLQVYLEGARTYTKIEKNQDTGITKPLYKNSVAQVIITYTSSVNIFSIRGKENITFESPLEQTKCNMSFYGDAKVVIKDMDIPQLVIDIYGSSILKMEKGTADKLKIRAYGSSTIMANNAVTKETKINTYGDGNYFLNVTEKIKINAYGSSTISYKGGAILKKGIVIGESIITKLD